MKLKTVQWSPYGTYLILHSICASQQALNNRKLTSKHWVPSSIFMSYFTLHMYLAWPFTILQNDNIKISFCNIVKGQAKYYILSIKYLVLTYLCLGLSWTFKVQKMLWFFLLFDWGFLYSILRSLLLKWFMHIALVQKGR